MTCIVIANIANRDGALKWCITKYGFSDGVIWEWATKGDGRVVMSFGDVPEIDLVEFKLRFG